MDLREQLQAVLGGTYTLERELGGGGMSRVFVATETALGRRIVIKVLPPEMAAQVSGERFQREIALAAQLQHAHIVPLLSAGEADGLPYYTMPYVDGESLRARLTRERELPIGDTIGVLKEVARALAYAHQRGVVHRDIKPDNVLLSGGSVMVTDFGVAKALSASTNAGSSSLTSIGVALGTPAYMAPEQASADPLVDHRADLYAFGAMAYELLTGQPPFAGRPPQAVLAAHVSEVPDAVERRRPSTPTALAHLVTRCLSKRAADRPQDATEILQALDAVVTPGSGMLPGAPDSSRASRGVLASPWARFTAAGILVVVTGIAMLIGRHPLAEPSIARAPSPSIAVMPFKNLSGAQEDEPFTEGMTGEIADALVKVPGLNVAATSLAKAATDGAEKHDLRSVGQQLKVASFLQGSVQRLGGRVRVTTQLVNVASGFEEWSGKYEFDFKDVFAVQDTIARAIVAALRVKLGGRAERSLVRAATTNPDAHALYLQGLYLWNRRTYENLQQAIAFFERAIGKDPTYAQAQAGVGLAYAMIPLYADVNGDAMYARAAEAARRALLLDSTSAEAHAALGYAELGVYHNANAERELRAAIRCDSTFPTAHQWLGQTLTRVRRFDEGIAEGRRAVDLDPQSGVIFTALSNLLYQARRYTEAEDIVRQLLAFDQSFTLAYRNRAAVFLAEGRTGEAVDAAQRFVEMLKERPSWPVALLGVAYAANGQTAQARQLLNELLARSERGPVSAAGVALLYEALGNRENALRWLERGVAQHDKAGFNWSRGPLFDGLRADPRGAALLARVESANDER